VISILQLTNHITKGLPIEKTDEIQESRGLLPVRSEATEIQERAWKKIVEDSS
jgi:hypothetical protein